MQLRRREIITKKRRKTRKRKNHRINWQAIKYIQNEQYFYATLVLNGSNECYIPPSSPSTSKRNEVTLGDPVETGPSFWSRSTSFVVGNSCHVELRLGIHCGHEGIQLCPLAMRSHRGTRKFELTRRGIRIARYASGLLTSGDVRIPRYSFLVGRVLDDIFSSRPRSFDRIRIRRFFENWNFRGRRIGKREK